MVNGTLAWLKNGLQPPEIVREKTEEYLGANDFFADWVQERCATGPEQQDKFDNLYANWKGYCEIWDERPGRKQDFTDQLERHGYRRRRGNPEDGGTHFVGLRVK